MAEQIEGRNPVLEALRAGHPINKVYVFQNGKSGPMRTIIELARKKGIPVHPVAAQVLDRMAATRNHQGVIAVAAEWKYASIDQILHNSTLNNEPPLIVVLDGVEDPQNLGSIIRSAEAAGAHGIIIPERRAAGLTATVSRASAGAVEYLPIARVTNLTKTIRELKKAGLWFTGIETNGEIELYQADLSGAIGLVLGGEGRGISRLVAEECDQIVKLPLWGRVNSLNVSVAAGIALYEVRRVRTNIAK
ncbi:MAG: 23S rRNA (guanosine(2251)-2'-O)-methyltransferase RlmB [Firmicutes bacterium]|nr:23S rRNA (guanosine(2251)-2'-O)-methyltransferase RlmB [Bacillota bacterium]